MAQAIQTAEEAWEVDRAAKAVGVVLLNPATLEVCASSRQKESFGQPLQK